MIAIKEENRIMTARVLIVDDERHTREGLQAALESDHRLVETAEDGNQAWEKIQKHDYDVLITDIRMPEMDGMQLLRKISEKEISVGVIVLTAYGSIEMAVEAMKLGAFNYLTKPVNLDELELLVEQLLEKRRIELENQYHREREIQSGSLDGLIGTSPPMRKLKDQIQQIAPSKANVLITGETGTGKELVARAIHGLSPRKDRLFVPIHCAALSENLLESELFGHERGAFTGAVKQRKGRFELADKGTLFLDEISEISESIQVKLLRVLQQKEFERVGGTETISVDIRILAATNADLAKLVEEGKFREDLYYRLKVITIHTPPLRERLSDIPQLVNAFVKKYAYENGKKPPTVSDEVIRIFQQYSWPGNVRELEGVVESMIILAQGNRLEKDNIPYEIRQSGDEMPQPVISGDATLADIEKTAILQTLEKHNHNRTKTAEALGIGRRTLIRKLHEYGVSKAEEENES